MVNMNRARWIALAVAILCCCCCSSSKADELSDSEDYEECPDCSDDEGEEQNALREQMQVYKIYEYLNQIEPKVIASDNVQTIQQRPSSSSTISKEKTSIEPDQMLEQADQPMVVDIARPGYNNYDYQADYKPLYAFKEPAQTNYAMSTQAKSSRLVPTEWKCQLQANNSCGIVNDEGTGKHFHLQYSHLTPGFASPKWYFALNTSQIERSIVGTRLITPYIPTKNVPTGCLKMEYVTWGNEIDKLIIYQQDKDNHCIVNKQFDPNSLISIANHIIDETTIDLTQGDPRFFIELYFHRFTHHKSGLAIANFQVNYEPCGSLSSNRYKCPQPIDGNRKEETSTNNQVIP